MAHTLDILQDYKAHEILCDVLRHEAGRGGFGKVVVGKHKTAGFVAVKCFSVNGGEMEQEALKKLIHHEFDMLLRSRHANIANVYGLTKWPGAMGIVMQYYEGGNMRTVLLSDYISLGHSLRLRLATETATAVAHIHHCGSNKHLVHGDLKPENVLLTTDLHAKIADFGCAKVASLTGFSSDQNLDSQEKVVLTLFYAAPEKLLHNARPKREQDIFSCGVMYHMLIFRCIPYLSISSTEDFRQMLAQGVRPNCDAIQELKNSCNENDKAIIEDIEKMMKRCWNQDPAQRPKMLEVRDKFKQHLATQDPAMILQQVNEAVRDMDIRSPAANHNPTVPLTRLNPTTGMFPSESSQPPLPCESPPEQGQNSALTDCESNITAPISVETKRDKVAEFVAIGGWGSERDCVKYDATTKQHKYLQRLKFGRIDATSAKVGQKMYVSGGNNEAAMISCEMLDLETNEPWQMMQDMSKPRQNAASAVIGDNFFVAGGRNNGGKLSSCEVYDASRNDWSMIPDMLHQKSNHTMCSIGNSLYCFGGTNSPCEHYDVRHKKWNLIPSMEQGLSDFSCVALNGKIHVMGGLRSSNHECYDPTASRWTTLAPMSIDRAHYGACVINGKIYVAGGLSSAGGPLKMVEVYDPAQNSWSYSCDLEKNSFGHTVLAL